MLGITLNNGSIQLDDFVNSYSSANLIELLG